MLKTVSSAGSGGTVGGVVYQGTWNASTNTPTLISGVGTKGYYYVVSVAGNTNLDGTILWGVGDWAVFNGTAWQKVDGGDTSAVTSLTVTSLTGYMYANNSSAVTASTTIPVANVTGAVANTVYVIAGTNLTGGGALTGNVTINSSYNGTVTNVATGTGLSGGPITSTGTISLANTAVTAGTYGNATTVAQVVIDAQGRITSASNVAISGGSNGTVTNVATGTGLTGGPITSTGTISLANTAVTAGAYGNASTVATFTVDAQGRLTAAANATIAIANTAVSGLGTMSVQNSNNVTITGGSINVQASNLISTTSSNATFATASLPLVPAGYIQVNLNGTVVKVPYYAV